MYISSNYVGDIMDEFSWYLCWLFASYVMYITYGSWHVLMNIWMFDKWMDQLLLLQQFGDGIEPSLWFLDES